MIFFTRICSVKCKTHVFPPFHTHSRQSNGPHCKVEITQASALSLPSPQEIWKHLLFFFTLCPFIRVLSFFLYFRVRCKTNQTLRRRCARSRGGSHGSGGGINQGGEKRLPCQSATAWWSTRCQPCLHITASSAAKVELTLRPSLAQSDALASHHAEAVTYSRNSFSHLLPPPVPPRAHAHTRCLYACMGRRMAHRVFIIWVRGEIIPGRKSFLTAPQWLLM